MVMEKDKAIVAARGIVDVIMRDLSDRRGIGNAFEEVDPEIYEDMMEELRNQVTHYLHVNS